MNSFNKCRKIEALGIEMARPVLDKVFSGGWKFLDDKRLQYACHTDIVGHDKGGKFFSVEMKAETEDIHGNFFIELISNASAEDDKFRTGWIDKSIAEFIVYAFLSNRTIYIIPRRPLKVWFLENIEQYRLKRQEKYEQHNQTIGIPVPIEHVRVNVGFRKWQLVGDTWVSDEQKQRELITL